MPFTLAHPAAVWPLKYVRYFAVIPLVIGSLTPDLTSYLPNAHALINSHSLRGTVELDLPLGYGLLFFVVMLRQLLVMPLWEPHRSFIRNAFSQFLAIRYWWLLAIPSLLIGSWTHIAWDSFTHDNHFMVRNLSILQHSVAIDGDHTVQLYRVLQYACSVLGLVAIAWWYQHTLRTSKLPTEVGTTPKRILLGLVVSALIAGLITALLIPPDLRSVYAFISTILTTAMPVFTGMYLVTGAVLWMRNYRNASRLD
jgi:hypothetical protein